MQPSPTPQGAAELVVVVERKPFDASVSVDNRGTRFIGPYEATLAGAANNLFGRDDRTELRTNVTSPRLGPFLLRP